ncbi:PE domain-containing protein [Amycolatopsis viridis]|uniref:PE domain-containing protein n=1 Tax=Amycolatopsis viridis TaxID=185678 RepID=A0ABX0SLK3_9PSEU|nr:PE domain-containing protein [Amycolatopsis viridis]NIH77868.1 hypothetical protein [Amycolatopsis viridis]
MAEHDLSGAGQGLVPTLGALGATVPSVPADLRVDPHQLVAVANVIDEQAGALDERIRRNLADLDITAPAQDVISTTAIDAWNRLVARGGSSYAERVRAYVGNLRELAARLRQAAQSYQTGEDEKAATLRRHRPHGS